METKGRTHFRRCRFRLRTFYRWLWYRESAPVTAGEFLLRAIPNTPSYYKESMGTWAVDPYSFKPNEKRDIDGMSFFREDFTTAGEIVKFNRHPSGASIALLRVTDLVALGLSVLPSPDADQPPGHAIVPEMAFIQDADPATKRRQKDLSQRIAQLASKGFIVMPTRKPAEAKT